MRKLIKEVISNHGRFMKRYVESQKKYLKRYSKFERIERGESFDLVLCAEKMNVDPNKHYLHLDDFFDGKY